MLNFELTNSNVSTTQAMKAQLDGAHPGVVPQNPPALGPALYDHGVKNSAWRIVDAMSKLYIVNCDRHFLTMKHAASLLCCFVKAVASAVYSN